jgi:hypothetical protein
MSESLELRKHLWQHDDVVARRSTGVPSPRSGEPARISDEQVHRARIAVARGAVSTDDCRLLLEMLGLAPGEDGIPPVSR